MAVTILDDIKVNELDDDGLAAASSLPPQGVEWALATGTAPSIITASRADRLSELTTREWANGVARRGSNCAGIFAEPGNRCDDPNIVPDPPYPLELPPPSPACYFSFYPFFLGNCEGGCCDDILNPERLAANTVEDLDHHQASLIAAEFHSGYFGRGSSLQRNAVDITPGVVHHLVDGLGEITARMRGTGTWHIDARLNPLMQHLGLVTFPNGGALPTGPMGWPISFGPGYPNVGPVSSPWRPDPTSEDPDAAPAADSIAAAAGEAWIYAHPGVVDSLAIDVPAEIGGGDAFGHLQNQQTNLLRRYAIAAANLAPCQTFAVRVTTSPCCP